MKRIGMSILCAALGAGQTAHGQGANEIGQATQAWLTLQSSNAAAAPAQPMPGAQAGAAYERYLKSFETAIPAHFGSSFEDAGRPSLDVNYRDMN
ncbi:lipoprotein [Caballeronia peredens]|nr:lipoprotein [Caballeronia peredens]